LNPQLKQWKDIVPSALLIMPPRFFLSADSPLCMQQGALKLIQPLGVFFRPAGSEVRIVFCI